MKNKEPKDTNLKMEFLKKGETIEYLPFNRTVTANLELQESLREYGFLDPIKVIESSLWSGKKRLYIIDGHHRYNEAYRMGMKIYYIKILESNNIFEIVKVAGILNNIQRKWLLTDFVRCYCELAICDYMYLRRKQQDTGYTYATLTNIYSGQGATALKRGKFKIPDVNKGDLILSYCKDVLSLIKLPMRSILGFASFYNNIKNYDHERFMKNLKSNLSLLDNCIERSQYAEKFTNIYNRSK